MKAKSVKPRAKLGNLSGETTPPDDNLQLEKSVRRCRHADEEIAGSSGLVERYGVKTREPNPNLPARLFAADRYPDGARLNIYSRPEYLGDIAEILKGSYEWNRISRSQFGHLFYLPVARCSHLAKLIHGILSRQLVTRKQNELWFVYGGFPLRFSLREFHITTGLRCGPLPTTEEIENHQNPAYLSVWNRLFGEKAVVTVQYVLKLLREGTCAVEKNNQLSVWKKLSLALIIIVICLLYHWRR